MPSGQRKALFIGVDYYENVADLTGCVDDAHRVAAMLERHADGRLNFANPRVMTGTSAAAPVTRAAMKEAVRQLFEDDSEVALLYFSGHGHVEDTGGFLCGSDAADGDDGLALNDVMTIADASPAKNKIVLLDSCYSGSAGNNPALGQAALIREGMTILSASTATQEALGGAVAADGGPGSVFTNLLVDALNGAAANLVGDITPGSVYAHIDQSLGPWTQRPVFKTNVKNFVSLREADPPIDPAKVRQITKIFSTPDQVLALDPTFEPERTSDQEADPNYPEPDPTNTAIFAVLQAYNRVNLAVTVGADPPHMWHAATQSKGCRLTALGQHYWNLVDKGRF